MPDPPMIPRIALVMSSPLRQFRRGSSWQENATLAFPPSQRGQKMPKAIRIECAFAVPRLQLDHVEIALGRAAFGADPVVRDLGPARARCEALVRVAFFLVIDVAAAPALPG